MDAAYSAAARAFPGWRRMSPAGRQQQLLDLVATLEARVDDLVEAEVSNTGKPLEATRTDEIVTGIDHLRYFAGLSEAQQPARRHSSVGRHRRIAECVRSGPGVHLLHEFGEVVLAEVTSQVGLADHSDQLVRVVVDHRHALDLVLGHALQHVVQI